MDKNELLKYIEKGYSTYGLARHFGKGQTTICYWLNKYNIKTKVNKNDGNVRKLPAKENDCLNCDEKVAVKYCNQRCQVDHQYKEYVVRWKSGLESGIVGQLSISRYIRRYLFEKYNSKCSECGWCSVNEYSNRIPLEVEHIDGNHENNTEENLTLLCPNCHSLTSTYRGLNMGNGRAKRKGLTIK